MPVKVGASSHGGFTLGGASRGSMLTTVWLPGHDALIYSVKSEKRAALDAYSHPSILFRTGSMIPLRLSTITLIRSSIRKALSRRITTFSSAIEKHVIIATE